MTRVLVLYNQPADCAAFDRYYAEVHAPIAVMLPGLRAYSVSTAPPKALQGGPAPYLVAELEFDDAEALQAAFASPEGQATMNDIPKFTAAGVTIMTYEVQTA